MTKVLLIHGWGGTIYKDVESAMIFVDGLELATYMAEIQISSSQLLTHTGAADVLELLRHTHRVDLSIMLNRG